MKRDQQLSKKLQDERLFIDYMRERLENLVTEPGSIFEPELLAKLEKKSLPRHRQLADMAAASAGDVGGTWEDRQSLIDSIFTED